MAFDVNAHKQELRAHALVVRQGLPAFEPAWAGLKPLLDRLAPTEVVLTYLASSLEPDALGVRAFTQNKLAVTRTPTSGRSLTLHYLDESTELERHPFGFLQPLPDAPEVQLAAVGLVLAPGLAFDRQGGRLGHGAGYYDRLLSHLAPDAPLIGVVHSELVVQSVPMLEHDVQMTHLLTEQSLITCDL